MTTKFVTYCSHNKLPCTFATVKDVILCLSSDEKVAPINCPSPSEDEYKYSFIEATVCQGYTLDECCVPQIWNYTFSYDDDQLLEGEVLITEDIVGVFCKSCITSWVEQKIGNEPYIRTEESGSQTFVSPHGCEYPIECEGTGLEVNDTNSIDLTLASDVLSGDVKISSDPDNGLSIEADGLFANPGPWWPGVTLFGDGADGDLTILNGEDEEIPERVRNMFYENLTINAGGILHPYGFFRPTDGSNPDRFFKTYVVLFVSDTLTINGTLSADGDDGSNGSGAFNSSETTGGAAPGAELAQPGPGGGQDYGGSGGRGQRNGAGDSNKAWVGAPCGGLGGNVWSGIFTGGFGGAGGQGGGNGTVSGANGGDPETPPDGTSTANTFEQGPFLESYADFSRLPFLSVGQFLRFFSGLYINSVVGGTGGGGGGGGTKVSTASGGMGGGGGAGGGAIFIYARNVVIGAAGVISAIGGNGGDGAAATASGSNPAGGGGGGAGGGGGLVYIVYENLTNNGTIDVSGGAGGNGAAGVDGGGMGSDGEDGLDGHVYLLSLTDGALTYI